MYFAQRSFRQIFGESTTRSLASAAELVGCLAEVVLDFFESVDVDPSEAQYLLEVRC